MLVEDTRFKKSRGYDKILEQYPDLMQFHKWDFYCNVPPSASRECLEKIEKEFKEKGIQMCLGSITFDNKGYILPRAKAVFTRKIKHFKRL